jgi:hypothetical protein
LAAKRPGSPLTLLPSQFAADLDHSGNLSGARLDAPAFFRYFPAQVNFRKGVLGGGELRAEIPPLRAGNARERAECALTTHFDARRCRF